MKIKYKKSQNINDDNSSGRLYFSRFSRYVTEEVENSVKIQHVSSLM